MSNATRNLCVTINNPTIDIHQWLEIVKAAGALTARCQLERGESGTPHIQGFISFKSVARFSKVTKLFPGCHVEAARNAFKSYEYCGKEDTRVEGPVQFGPLPKP